MLLPLQRDGDVGKLLKGNEEFRYMYIAERDVPIWKFVHVSKVGGHLQRRNGGQQSGGSGSEQGAAVANGGETRELAIVTR